MSIFSNIFGKSDSSSLIDKLDSLVDKLPVGDKSDQEHFDNLASKTIKDIIQYSDDSKENEKTQSHIEQLFNGITLPRERINRYNVYDELFKTVPLIKRIFGVYTANVFQKDTISNKILYIRDKTNLKNDAELENSKKVAKVILSYYSLDDKLKHFIGHNVFKYGDAFLEILDLDNFPLKFPVIAKNNITDGYQTPKDKAQIITDVRDVISNGNGGSYLAENRIIDSIYTDIKSKNRYKQTSVEKHMDEFASLFVEFNDQIEYYDDQIKDDTYIFESEDFVDLKKIQDIDESKFKRVAIRLHKPHKILPLLSPYGNILGFLELKTIEKQMTTNNLHRFLEIVEKISAITKEGNTKDSTDALITKFVEYTVKKILEKYKIVKGEKQSFSDYEQTIKDALKDDLFYSLKQTFLSVQTDSLFRNKTTIRFINVDNLFWFKSPSSEYYPLL
jgi:hypothetical protein